MLVELTFQERQKSGPRPIRQGTRRRPLPHLFDDKQRKNRKIVDVHVVSAVP